MSDSSICPVRHALLSVSDKTGLLELGRSLRQLGVEIISTGGTAKALRAADIDVTDVSEVTGFPEIMDGRVKTLHPIIHGGLLGREGTDDAVMQAHGIQPIDLVVVNLYPFAQVIAKPEVTLADAVENIDIGGPTMLRSAAKNHARVTVLTSPEDYAELLAVLREKGGTTLAMRRRYAAKVYVHTARYDGMIADWLGARFAADADAAVATPTATFAPTLHLGLDRVATLRYGENPHQRAALYRAPAAPHAGTVASARVLAGKPLSYNNYADADAALECVKNFDAQPACVIVKHANPCGVALGQGLADAYARAFACDPVSSFGGIVAFNRTLDAVTAAAILEQQFVEVIMAPEVQDGVLEVLARKPNVRLLATGAWPRQAPASVSLKQITGALLAQDTDRDMLAADDLEIVTERAPSATERADLLFAWKIVMFVKSNAIVYAHDGQTTGIGAGQMSRVVSARVAAMKAADAKLELKGSVMASDAFLPFRDGLDAAAAAGISAVIQPGGSIRDREVIAAANEHGMAMAFTHVRHFRH